MFLKGENPNSIAKLLTDRGVPTPAGKKVWSYSTIKSILSNEKYKGDALLQKSFTVDFLTKTRKVNQGELPQYYIENNHEAIIDKATFDMVQVELKSERSRTTVSYFGKVVCGCCGGSYGRHTWHSNSKYKRFIYRCNQKYKGLEKCDTPHVSSEEIENWSSQAISQLITNKDEIINNLEILMTALEYTEEIETELETISSRLLIIQEEVEQLVSQNAKVAQNQSAYQKKYDELVEKYHELQKEHSEKQLDLHERKIKLKELNSFIDILKQQEKLDVKYDEKLFNTLFDMLVIYKDKKVEVNFKNGQVISI